MSNCDHLSLEDAYPTRTAPRNSINDARTMACFIVNDREDTDVANELATSLAPMFLDRRISHKECFDAMGLTMRREMQR